MSPDRKPALRGKSHPLETIAAAAATGAGTATGGRRTTAKSPHREDEDRPVTDQVNVRMRRELNQRLEQAAFTLAAQRGQKTTKVTVIEEALTEYFDRHKLP